MGYALDSVGWTWLLDTAPARKTLTAALGGERLRIRDGVRVVVAAVEECSGEVVHFTNSAPPGSGFTEVQLTVDHLMAGAAAPIRSRPCTSTAAPTWTPAWSPTRRCGRRWRTSRRPSWS
ncbi:hypothetical protein GCM10018954_072200 [Kutzneria kofuensis]